MEITYLTLYLKSDKNKRGIPDHVVQIKSGEEIIWVIPDSEFSVEIFTIEELKARYNI